MVGSITLVIVVLIAFVALPLSYDLLSSRGSGDQGVVAPLPSQVSAAIRVIERQEVAIRGLTPLKKVKINFVPPARFVAKISRMLQSGNTPHEIGISKTESTLAGEVPPATNLEHILTSSLPTEVVGLYDRHSKQLFVKNTGQALGIDRWTIAHEYTHALQDQHFGLTRLEPDQSHWKLHNSDEELAVHSLVEGDAVDVQYAYLERYYSPSERQALYQQQQSTPSPVVPRTIQEQFDFPYTTGPNYVNYLLQQGGYGAVNRAFRHPPTTTYQLMFPGNSNYVRHLKITSVLGDFRNWAIVDDDVNGAFGYQQLVEQFVSPGLANRLASLWRGDRYLLIHRGGRYAMYMRSVYANGAAAQEAGNIIRLSLAKRFDGLHNLHGRMWAGKAGTFAAIHTRSNRVILAYGHSRKTVLRLVASPTD
jgi:hypothetical protein